MCNATKRERRFYLGVDDDTLRSNIPDDVSELLPMLMALQDDLRP